MPLSRQLFPLKDWSMLTATNLATTAGDEVPKRPHFDEGRIALEGSEHAPAATTGGEVSKGLLF